MSDYYDGYREGMAQASRETAALREQLDAMLNSVSDMKSLMMPPPPIHLTIPAARMPMSEEEAIELCPFTREEFKAGFLTGIRFAEKHHGINIDKSDPDSIDLQSRCRGDKE